MTPALDRHDDLEVELAGQPRDGRRPAQLRQMTGREKLHQRSRFSRRSPKSRPRGGVHLRRGKRVLA